MADNVTGTSTTKVIVGIVLAVVVTAAVLWWLGVFQPAPKNTREVYTTDTKDLSGGHFRVTDQSTPAVPVNLPETKMHNATPQEAASASAAPAGK